MRAENHPRTTSRVVLSLFAALSCIAVLGCAPSASDPIASPEPSRTPAAESTPSPTPQALHVPVSRLGVDCDSVPADVVALVAPTVDAEVSMVDPLVTASRASVAIPRKVPILAVGGLVCEWSNGAPYSDQAGSNPAYAGVIVSVTPMPDEGWSDLFLVYELTEDRRACPAEITGVCALSAVTDSAMVAVEARSTAQGAIDRAAVEALFSATFAMVVEQGALRPSAAVERTRERLPSDCDGFLPLDTARSISGVPGAEPQQGGGGGWSDWAEARLSLDMEPCTWSDSSTAPYAAMVSWVPDGRWALDRVQASEAFRSIVPAWLVEGDDAGLRCDGPDGFCAVDIALGPDWVSVAGRDEESALRLAEAVVLRLSGEAS